MNLREFSRWTTELLDFVDSDCFILITDQFCVLSALDGWLSCLINKYILSIIQPYDNSLTFLWPCWFFVVFYWWLIFSWKKNILKTGSWRTGKWPSFCSSDFPSNWYSRILHFRVFHAKFQHEWTRGSIKMGFFFGILYNMERYIDINWWYFLIIIATARHIGWLVCLSDRLIGPKSQQLNSAFRDFNI